MARRRTRASRKIRVGYVSGEFCVQATAFLMAGVFERHDRARFETTAISLGPNDCSALRARVMKSFDRFLDVRGGTDRSRKPDPCGRDRHRRRPDGLLGNSRQGILAFRPAPVQVNYLGFPGTMAAPHVDYIIADRDRDPERPSNVTTARRSSILPDTYMPSDARRRVSDRTFSRAEGGGLPETGIVFCCFNNSYKLTPEIFSVWMRLLKAVEGSVLWLLETTPAVSQNLRREAARRGVAPERTFACRPKPSCRGRNPTGSVMPQQPSVAGLSLTSRHGRTAPRAPAEPEPTRRRGQPCRPCRRTGGASRAGARRPCPDARQPVPAVPAVPVRAAVPVRRPCRRRHPCRRPRCS